MHKQTLDSSLEVTRDKIMVLKAIGTFVHVYGLGGSNGVDFFSPCMLVLIGLSILAESVENSSCLEK